MSRDRAAYMRDYRAKKRAAQGQREMDLVLGTGEAVHRALVPRIRELEEEVKQLKAELEGARDSAAMQRNLDADIAARSPVGRERFNTQPFSGPIPKVRKR